MAQCYCSWFEAHNMNERSLIDVWRLACTQSMTVRETLEFARKCQMGSTPPAFSPVVEGRKLAGQHSTAAGDVPVLRILDGCCKQSGTGSEPLPRLQQCAPAAGRARSDTEACDCQ